MAAEFILYNYFRSSASHRVRCALHYKEIPFEYRAVHLLNNGGEQHASEYTKLNPSHEVPTLIHNGRAIGQSVAIIDYLDRVNPAKRLFPEDPYQRARVLQACEIVNSGSQPNFNLRVLGMLEKSFGATQDQKNGWAQHWMNYGLRSLEDLLMTQAGEFCFGNDITAADCFLIPHLYSADRFHVTLEKYPTISRIRGNGMKLDAFKRAAPDAQPDYQPPAKT